MSSLLSDVNLLDSTLVLSLFISLPSIILINSEEYHY